MKIDIGQLQFIDKRLRDILIWIEELTGSEQTVTSLYRIGSSGVHGTLPLRGTDLRCRIRSNGELIEAAVNEKWAYDLNRPDKKCAFLHGEGYNLHLHLQVHPNTIKRG